MTALDPDTKLDILLSTICSRNRHVSDPAPVIAELKKTAGDRTEILAHVAGTWSGYHETDPYVRVLVAALAEIDGADAWIPLGRRRRHGGTHTTPAA